MSRQVENWFWWKMFGRELLWKFWGKCHIWDILEPLAFQKYSIFWVLKTLSLSFYSSFCKSLFWSSWSPDDKRSENIWFVWSRTSHSAVEINGDVIMRDEQLNEDRATQLMLNAEFRNGGSPINEEDQMLAIAELPISKNLPWWSDRRSLMNKFFQGSDLQQLTILWWSSS